jgi:hypothetical protein
MHIFYSTVLDEDIGRVCGLYVWTERESEVFNQVVCIKS